MDKTYAENLASALGGEFVEIYLGETYEQIKMEQSEENNPAIICGKILEACGNMLIIEAGAFKNKKFDHLRRVYINDYAIKFVCLLEPSTIGATNIFMDSREASKVYQELTK